MYYLMSGRNIVFSMNDAEFLIAFMRKLVLEHPNDKHTQELFIEYRNC